MDAAIMCVHSHAMQRSGCLSQTEGVHIVKNSKPTLCVDFDGVIHAYTSPWTDAVTISDGPVPGAIQWLWKASEHFVVYVYSSRSKEPLARDAMCKWLFKCLREEFGPDDPRSQYIPLIFASEKPAAFLTIDDRALCFDGDWSKLDPEELLKFRPWNKKES
jgi:hypothetical protein